MMPVQQHRAALRDGTFGKADGRARPELPGSGHLYAMDGTWTPQSLEPEILEQVDVIAGLFHTVDPASVAYVRASRLARATGRRVMANSRSLVTQCQASTREKNRWTVCQSGRGTVRAAV